MKKAGILTITRGQNYGNKLQNFAVQEVLKQLGFEPETLVNTTERGFPDRIRSVENRLSPAYLMKSVRARLGNRLYLKDDSHSMIGSALWVNQNRALISRLQRQRVQAFERFTREHIRMSSFTIDKDHLPEERLSAFDYFVTGSDQVWNPVYRYTSSVDFLTFAPESKRIAFAPSFGVSEIPVQRQEVYAKWLRAFRALSVREDKGAVLIQKLTGLKVPVLVDPTMLITRGQWQQLAKKPAYELRKPFLLTYFLGNKTRAYEAYIRKTAKQGGCKVIDLNEIRATEYYATDPAEFLYLIEHAALVCTDSFHGSVLSILFRTPFVVFDRVEAGRTMGSRIETLLNKFGLQQHHFKNQQTGADPLKQTLPDTSLDLLIAAEIKRSHEYLKQSLTS